MKLVIITAIEAFKDEIKILLKKAAVISSTYQKVIGYKDASEESLGNNWFASEMNETDSILFYTFVDNIKSDHLVSIVNDFNAKQETKSKIHINILNIEQSNLNI
jgi:hypothetical protein